MDLDESWKARIETRLQHIETTVAVASERDRHIDRRFDVIEGHLRWILKITIGGLIGGIVTFIIKGGLVL